MTEFRVTIPVMVTLVSGIMLFGVGWLFAHALLRNEIETLRVTAVEARTVALKNQEGLYDVERKTIALEGTTTRMGQDVAEMRLRQLPRRN